jgi:hypothetical protein
MSKFGALLQQYAPPETFDVTFPDASQESGFQTWTFKGIQSISQKQAWEKDAVKWAATERVKKMVEGFGQDPEACQDMIKKAWFWAQTFIKSSTGEESMTPVEAIEFLRAPDLFQNIDWQWSDGQKTVYTQFIKAAIEEAKKKSIADSSTDSSLQELELQEAENPTFSGSE